MGRGKFLFLVTILFASIVSAKEPNESWLKWESWEQYHFVFESTNAAEDGIWRETPAGFTQVYNGPLSTIPSSKIPLGEFENIENGSTAMYVGAKDSSYGLAFDDRHNLIFVMKKNGVKFYSVPEHQIVTRRTVQIDSKTYLFLFVHKDDKGRVFVIDPEGEVRDLGSAWKISNNDFIVKYQSSKKEDHLKQLAKIAFASDAPQTPWLKSVTSEDLYRAMPEKFDSESTENDNLSREFTLLKDVLVSDNHGSRSSGLKIISSFTKNLSYEAFQQKESSFKNTPEFSIKLAKALVKNETGSAIVLGPTGSGKTASVKTFIGEVVSGMFPTSGLQDYTFLELDSAALASGTMYRGSIEGKIQALLEVSRANKIIWVVDEIHTLRGSGTSESNDNDILELLKRDLSQGSLRIIGVTTDQEYFASFGGDPAFNRRMTVVNKEVLKDGAIYDALGAWLKRYKLTPPSREIMEEVVRISSEMNPEGAQPAKSISLLEEVYAHLKISGSTSDEPTINDIRKSSADLYSVDPAFFDSSLRKSKLEKLSEHLNYKIVGQRAVKDAIMDQARQIFADVHDNNRPRMLALLTGPKGRGKTEMAVAYAEGLDLPYKILEMNSYASDQGYNRMGLMEAIADAMAKNAFTVLIFDEIEKAPISVQNELLRMFNNGEFNLSVNSKGGRSALTLRTMNARNATVFMTSNAGSSHIIAKNRNPIGFTNTNVTKENFQDTSLVAQLEADNMSGVLLDRSNLILSFGEQTKEDFKAILKNHLDRALVDIGKRHRTHFSLGGESEFTEEIANKYYSPEMSNREVLRIIQSSVRSILAETILEDGLKENMDVNYSGNIFSVSETCQGVMADLRKNK
jgi:ATP-dependent Clp protease ATP-binding subunit ClpA